MRGNTTASGENTLRRDHAAQIFRRSFDADEQDFFALRFGFHRAFGVEIDFASGRTRPAGRPVAMTLAFFTSLKSKIGASNCSSWSAGLRRIAVSQSINFSFTMSAANLSAAAAVRLPLRVWSMNKLAALHGELDVLHVLEMTFQRLADGHQFRVALWHLLLELQHGFRSANAGDNVFALRVDEEFAVEFVGAIRRIARERHAGTRIVTILPNTIACTLTAVPHSAGILYLRR